MQAQLNQKIHCDKMPEDTGGGIQTPFNELWISIGRYDKVPHISGASCAQ